MNSKGILAWNSHMVVKFCLICLTKLVLMTVQKSLLIKFWYHHSFENCTLSPLLFHSTLQRVLDSIISYFICFSVSFSLHNSVAVVQAFSSIPAWLQIEHEADWADRIKIESRLWLNKCHLHFSLHIRIYCSQ